MLEHQLAVHEYYEDQPRLAALFPRTDAGELGWLPAVDVRHLPDEVVVFAALPGVPKADIKIEVEPGALTISGRRQARSTDGWLRREMIAGPFTRRIELPAEVRAQDASAAHVDGILEVHLPKTS